MYMRLDSIIDFFDDWAPKWAAWEKDSVGLQVGDRQRNITRALVTLDVTRKIIDEAVRKKAELIISHHPILYRSPSSITTTDPVGDLILRLAQNKIALFSAHTNLDYSEGGVSNSLAKKLGLENIKFLSPLRNTLAKIVVFVPEGYVQKVTEAMSKAGAGVIGEYSSCSFQTKGIGSFRGSISSNPFLGKSKTLESTDETRLEMIVPRASISEVVAAMKDVHPYEEVAYDVYFIENKNVNFGMGALGSLPKPQLLSVFLKSLKRKLGCKAVRFTKGKTNLVQNIAVCGGGGSKLLTESIAAKADVFVTADVNYHTFESAEGKIALVDAGHWETERVILKPIAERLRAVSRAANEELSVFITKNITNPIQTI